MISAVNRHEHYHALRDNSDAIGYCLNLFYDKTDSNRPKSEVVNALTQWIRIQGILTMRNPNLSLTEGCVKIKDFFSKKFA